MLQDWIGRFSVREKSRANLVTEADEASQTAIVQTLKNRFPQHGFLGEENLNELSQENSDNAHEQENTMPVIDENKTED